MTDILGAGGGGVNCMRSAQNINSGGGLSQVKVPDIDAMAQFIRKIDGDNTMGARELAGNICEWLSGNKGGE